MTEKGQNGNIEAIKYVNLELAAYQYILRYLSKFGYKLTTHTHHFYNIFLVQVVYTSFLCFRHFQFILLALGFLTLTFLQPD